MPIAITGPSVFFFVDGTFLFHECTIESGEEYGQFVNYPYSHYDIWHRNYESKYLVDFDYYPRGRVVYRKSDNTYLIYYDKCMEFSIGWLLEHYSGKKYELGCDEHYQCHLCNENYVV